MTLLLTITKEEINLKKRSQATLIKWEINKYMEKSILQLVKHSTKKINEKKLTMFLDKEVVKNIILLKLTYSLT